MSCSGYTSDKAVVLGRRIKELENRSLPMNEYTTTQEFLNEQELGTRIQVELGRDAAEATFDAVARMLGDLDAQILAASSFAADLRDRHRDAARRAQRAAALLRDRETQLRRFIPLRAQYADDVAKLTMLAEARTLFDPLREGLPCVLELAAGRTPCVAHGHCTLCTSTVTSLDDGHDEPTSGSLEREAA